MAEDNPMVMPIPVAIIEPKIDVTPLIAHIHGTLIFVDADEIMLIPVGKGIPMKKPR